MGGLIDDKFKHVNYAMHLFHEDDIEYLERHISPPQNPASASARSLESFQLSRYSLTKLPPAQIFRLGQIFQRRKTSDEVSSIDLYIVDVGAMKEFRKRFNELDTDRNGLISRKEFLDYEQNQLNEEVFEQLSLGKEYIFRG